MLTVGREYLTFKEVGLLIGSAREQRRYGHRDSTIILVAHRHGLRAGELCALRWDQVDLRSSLFARPTFEEWNAKLAPDGRQ